MTKDTIQWALAHSFECYSDRLAIESVDKSITYSELERRSNHVAANLLDLGVAKGSIVGCYIKNIDDLIASIVAVLNIGAVFVPFDVNAPVNNTVELSKSIEINFWINDIELPKEIDSPRRIDLNLLSVEKETLQAFDYNTSDPVYIYFTSGSTGKPNAVLGKNGSLLQFINWEINEFQIEQFRVAQLTTPSFDAFLRDIFVPLLSGGTICLLSNRNDLKDPFKLKKWLNDNNINIIHCVPSVFSMLLQADTANTDFGQLKYILMSGERVKPQSLKQWYEAFGERIHLVNLYGATETTMIRTFYRISPEDVKLERVPIGVPIEGTRAVVLDEDMNVCEEEVVGELYIRTPYGTYGYINNPALNSKKFVQNPFTDNPDDLIYKTGDLCKLKVDGNLDFLGRKDRQVKIRGVRVELEGIENKIRLCKEVKEAAVLINEEMNSTLTAFVIPHGEGLDVEEVVKKHLQESLPDYLVPKEIFEIDEIPRKVNGKVDYKQLEDLWEIRREFKANNDEELKIYELWSEVLKHKNFNNNVSFFKVGGHSLNALLMVNKLQKTFDAKIPVNKVFELDTIEKQANYFISHAKGQYVDIAKAGKKEFYPVANMQKGLFFYQKLNPDSIAYNSIFLFQVEGKIDFARLENALQKLIQNHEILRTSFHQQGEHVMQKVDESGSTNFRKLNSKFDQENINEFISPFNLSKPTQFEVILFEESEARHTILINSHHIINDGFSQLIVFKSLIKLYNGLEVDRPKLQYKDFSEWQQTEGYRSRYKEQEEFWKKRLAGHVQLLELPLDFERPAFIDDSGNSISFDIEGTLYDKIISLAAQSGVTLNVFWYSVYSIFLSKVCNQDFIVMGTPVLGRPHADLEHTIGMFANTVVLNTTVDNSKCFVDLIKENKQTYLSVLDNQEYSLEEVIKWTDFKREDGRNPLIDTMYVYKDFSFESETQPKDLSIIPLPLEKNASKFDLSLMVDKGNDAFFLDFTYANKLFKRDTMDYFVELFKSLTQAVVDNPSVSLSDLKVAGLRHYNDDQEYLMSMDLENE